LLADPPSNETIDVFYIKKTGNVFTSKFVVTGPSSYKKRIYLAAVSQRLGNTGLGAIGYTI